MSIEPNGDVYDDIAGGYPHTSPDPDDLDMALHVQLQEDAEVDAVDDAAGEHYDAEREWLRQRGGRPMGPNWSRITEDLQDAVAGIRQAIEGNVTDGESRRLEAEAEALRDALTRNALARREHERRRELIAKLGKDTFPAGTVIRWNKLFPDSTHEYVYVAVKAGALWYVTGRNQQNRRLTWFNLTRLMFDRGEVGLVELMGPVHNLIG